MKGKTRFLKSIIATAKEFDGQMPWARGAIRTTTIARRHGQQTAKRSA